MRFLFACGGTAGHVNPAVGVAGRIVSLLPESEILFIGAEGKMEMDLVPREGYQIRSVPVSSLSRSISVEGIRHNLQAVKDLTRGKKECRRILREFQPDAVIGTGGYVCFPVLSEAARMGIPTAVHESNAEPGLTTRMLEKSTDLIMVGFEEARGNYKHPEKVHVTGTPVRAGFMRTDNKAAKVKLGIPADRPLVVSVWGSLGATEMNKSIARMIGMAMEEQDFMFVHSAGKRGISGMLQYMQEDLRLTGWEEKGFQVKDYIFNMQELMAAADIILCRSGASTLAELAAMGKPAILVPSPNVVNNHQEKNARVLERAGAAEVIIESDASPEAMLSCIRALLTSPEKLAEMSDRMHGMAVENATDEITSLVLQLAAAKD